MHTEPTKSNERPARRTKKPVAHVVETRAERERREDAYLRLIGLPYLTLASIDAVYPSDQEVGKLRQLRKRLGSGAILAAGAQTYGEDHVVRTRQFDEARKRHTTVIHVSTEVGGGSGWNIARHNATATDIEAMIRNHAERFERADKWVGVRRGVLAKARTKGTFA